MVSLICVVCSFSSYIFIAVQYFFLWIYLDLFTHSLSAEHLGCCGYFAVIVLLRIFGACLNINIRTCFHLVCCKSEIMVPKRIHIFSFSKNYLNCSPVIIPISCPPAMYEYCSYSTLHRQYSALSVFFLVILVDVQWYFIVALVFIFLMTNKVEYFSYIEAQHFESLLS